MIARCTRRPRIIESRDADYAVLIRMRATASARSWPCSFGYRRQSRLVGMTNEHGPSSSGCAFQRAATLAAGLAGNLDATWRSVSRRSHPRGKRITTELAAGVGDDRCQCLRLLVQLAFSCWAMLAPDGILPTARRRSRRRMRWIACLSANGVSKWPPQSPPITATRRSWFGRTIGC